MLGNLSEEDVFSMIKENGRMILYVVDWLNMYDYRSIENHPLRYNPLTVDNCEILRVKVNKYDAARLGKGPYYQVYFKLWNSELRELSSESFNEYSSCLLIPVKDFVMVMRDVKLQSIGV